MKRGRRVVIGDKRSPMLRLLEQSGSDRVQVEYDQQWRTFFKALNLGFIEEAPSGGGVLTEKGKLFMLYEVKDNQLQVAGCYDDRVDAVIIKMETRNSGPVVVRKNGVKTKFREGNWITIAAAKRLAKAEGLPYGVV